MNRRMRFHLALVAALALAATAWGGTDSETPKEPAAARTTAAARPTGAFTVSVEARKLVGGCEGNTSASAPVVVLEAGDNLLPETLIPILDEFTREAFVCTYQRAGIGGS